MEMTREERLKYTEKAENLVSRMTLEEKVFLMSGGQSLQKITEAKRAGFHFNYTPFSAGGNKRLQVPDLRYCDAVSYTHLNSSGTSPPSSSNSRIDSAFPSAFPSS